MDEIIELSVWWLLKMPIRIGQGVYRALVLTHLWGWFAVPATGLHTLTLPVAYGLLLIASLFYSFNPSYAEAAARKGEKHLFLTDISLSLMQSSMIWGLGWLAHHFFF